MVRRWLKRLILWALGDDQTAQEQYATKIFSEWLNGRRIDMSDVTLWTLYREGVAYQNKMALAQIPDLCAI